MHFYQAPVLFSVRKEAVIASAGPGSAPGRSDLWQQIVVHDAFSNPALSLLQLHDHHLHDWGDGGRQRSAALEEERAGTGELTEEGGARLPLELRGL